jgi:hypothetical protein
MGKAMFIIFLISILLSSSVLAFEEKDFTMQNKLNINVIYIYENKNLSSNDIQLMYNAHIDELNNSFKKTYQIKNDVYDQNNFKLVGAVPYPSKIADENLSLIDFSFYVDANSQYLKDYYKELNFLIEETNANLIVFLGDSSKRSKDVTGKAKILAQGLGQYAPYKNKEQLYTTLFLFDDYASGDLTFVHEFGHLLGGAHADEIQSFYSESIQNGIFNYSKSFGKFQTKQNSGVVDAGFSTILGYHQVYNCIKGTGHDNCSPVAERNNIFSNPNLSICGPTNKETNVCGVANQSDMAKTLETTFPNFLKIKDKSGKKAIVMGYGHDSNNYMTATSGEDYIFGTILDDNGAKRIHQ